MTTVDSAIIKAIAPATERRYPAGFEAFFDEINAGLILTILDIVSGLPEASNPRPNTRKSGLLVFERFHDDEALIDRNLYARLIAYYAPDKRFHFLFQYLIRWYTRIRTKYA
jgi:hypothetical protein